MIYTTVFNFYKKTGVIIIITTIVMTMNLFGRIVPARSFLYSPFIILFYIIASIIPIMTADYIENFDNVSSLKKIKKRNTIYILLGGFIIGSSFYIFNFPMLTVVFLKLFGLPLTIGDIADNFFMILLTSYLFIYSIIVSSIFAGFMGLAGSYAFVKSKIFS